MESKQQLLVIGKVWPEPQSSAAGTRILQLIHIFKKNSFEVTFASAANRSEFSSDLSQMGIHEQEIELNDNSFNMFVASLDADVVLYDRYMTEEQYGWRVSESSPNTVHMLDTEDLHFLRRARELCVKEGENPLLDFKKYLSNEIMVRELASIMRCDFSIMISEFEINLLIDTFNVSASKLLHLPLLVSDEVIEQLEISPGFNDRTHFVTIGNFLHPPNWDSVLQLKQHIWPEIRNRIPSAELHIYGAYPTQKVWNLHNQSTGFIIKGRAENVQETLSNYKVMLAPLRFGAGQKGKLLDAMQSGLPTVTSSIGSESMQGECPWPGYITNEKAEFIEKAVSLYQQKEEWVEKQSAIKGLLTSTYLASKLALKFWEKFEQVMHQLIELREKDYFGQVLRNQTNNAAKYLGKWIEEKNKKA